MKKLEINFFEKDTEIVAKNLLGKIIKVGNILGIISETEAYKGLCDQASHAFPRKTPRNSLMYETFGFVYVYLIYGIHYCLNFTSDKNKPGAVLIRGVFEYKNGNIGNNINGPGKLTKFFKINKEFNGLNLQHTNKIQVLDDNIKINNFFTSPRIGISKNTDKLRRYYIKPDNILFK